MSTVMLSQNTFRCRLCLKVSSHVINIFREDFPKMIKLLTSIQVEQTDDLPKIACVPCARRVKSAMVIRKQIIRSHRTLLEEASARSHSNVSVESNTNVFSENSCQNKQDETENIKTEAPECIIVKVEDGSGLEEEDDVVFIHSTEPQISTNLDEKNFQHVSLSLDKNEISIVKINKLQPEKPAINVKAPLVNIISRQMKRDSKPQSVSNLNSNLSRNTNERVPARRNPKIMFKPVINIKPSTQQSPKPKPKPQKYDPFLQIPCKICQKRIQKTNMKKHLETHDKKIVTCHLCGKLTDHTSLRSHIFYFHKCKEDQYVCDQCGRHFRYKTKFKLHMKKEHDGNRDFECTICGRKFFERKYLNKHIDCHHKKIRPFICDYCGKNFSTKHALKVHLRQHTKTAPYSCDTCGLKFKQNVSLKTHRKHAHDICEEENVICEVCGKGFASKVALTSHFRLHERKKCLHCSEVFVRDDYLERHIKDKHETAAPDSDNAENGTEEIKQENEDELIVLDHVGDMPT